MIRKCNIIQYICNLVAGCFLIITFIGCSDEEYNGEGSGKFAAVSLSVSASGTGINEDNEFWEDRVDELRMLVFNPENGKVVFNQKLSFPNGFKEKCKAVALPPGTYDFYFVANESVHSGDFVTALNGISDKSEFETDSRYLNLAYDPGFQPDEDTPEGRFLMSAIYKKVTVAGGGTEEAPLMLALPTRKVELIRALAKVEIVFRKKIPGSTFTSNTINSVQLKEVASGMSVPPFDDYYTGSRSASLKASLSAFNYANDSIGSVWFYIPELLTQENGTGYTELCINDKVYPVQSDPDKEGITMQRRSVPVLSDNSVIRNYHYIINAYLKTDGGIEIRTSVKPWIRDKYIYNFEGDEQIVLPPVYPTDSSIIIPTICGKIELLSQNELLSNGLKEAYGDSVTYYDPATDAPAIYEGKAPYYCEKKYGKGWRLINSCELMSFLAVLDQTYTVWMSNTWDANTYNNKNPDKRIPFYPLNFRRDAQALLEKLTGVNLSDTELKEENNWEDIINDKKLGIVDTYFTPGDIKEKEDDYSGGWPFPSPSAAGETWMYNEAAIQVKAFWYSSGYVDLSNRSNWEKVLYGNFYRFDYQATSRCVRTVE